jgi:hypothetical protein
MNRVVASESPPGMLCGVPSSGLDGKGLQTPQRAGEVQRRYGTRKSSDLLRGETHGDPWGLPWGVHFDGAQRNKKTRLGP